MQVKPLSWTNKRHESRMTGAFRSLVCESRMRCFLQQTVRHVNRDDGLRGAGCALTRIEPPTYDAVHVNHPHRM